MLGLNPGKGGLIALSHGFRKLRILALMAALGLVLGLLGPGSGRESAEADLGTPGGISVLPSAAPGIPGVVNQGIPAIIRARAPGNVALVSVFCDPQAEAPWSGPNLDPSLPCPGTAPSPITFKLSRVYPPDGEAASTFSATATTELVCLTGPLFLPSLGGGPCDYNDRLGVVVVEVKGGGVNEIVRVTATDDIGESRSVDIVVVDTILAWGPNGVLSTAAQHEPAFISYACSDIGRTNVDEPEERADGPDPDDSTLPAYAEALGDDDGVLGLDDLWELMYHLASGLNFGPGMIGQAALNNNLTSDVDGLDLWWCGGDTASSIDDSVDFQTDLGVFSVDPAAVDIVGSIPDLLANFGILTPPSLDFDCGEGKDIDVSDADSLTVWASTLLGISGGEACDADFARNGVVTTSILGNGEVGVATIKAQQGGGVSPPRTINITFVGEAALSVFIDVPADIGAEGGEFDVFVVDQDGRPVGDETVECTVEPAGGALVVATAADSLTAGGAGLGNVPQKG